MSLLFTSDNFKTYLKEPSGDKKYLAYIDFRQQLYPPLTGHGLQFHTLKELFDRGGCDSPDPPLMLGETTAQAVVNGAWVRSAVQHYKGNYSWLLTKTTAVGAGDAEAFLVDGTVTTDMHGLEAGKKYTIRLRGYTDLAANWPYIQIKEYYGAAWNDTTIDTMSTTSAWEELTADVELNSATTGIQIKLIIPTNAANGSVFYVDEIWIQEENVTGSHIAQFGNLASDPHPQWCLEMPNSFTVWIRFKPFFAYNIAEDLTLLSWYVSATQKLLIYYDGATDKFLVEWMDGGTVRTLESQQYDDGSSHSDVNQWIDLVAKIDLTTGGITTGSALWIDWTERDTSWSGNIDAKSTKFPLMEVGHGNSSDEFDGEIAFIRLWPDDVATDTEIGDYFKTVKAEEVYFPFNGHGAGHTRCNVSRRVHNLDITISKESRAGYKIANVGSMTIDNAQGIFSDDQYASFDAGLEQYNGLVTDKFMQQRCGIELEIFYETGKVFEPLFTGRVDENGFSRVSSPGDKSIITVGFSDLVRSIENTSLDKSVYYEDYTFCNPATETESLIHLITRLASQQKIYNYASNSSFENAVITNSWVNNNLSTWTRQAVAILFGANIGRMVYDNVGGGVQGIYQDITFISDKSLNVGEVYNFSIYLLSASACSYIIKLDERDAGGSHDSTSTTYTIAGAEGWVKVEVTHTITDSTSDRLRISVEMNDNVTLDVDGAMLVQNNESWNFFILNADDGTAGVYDADDAVDNNRYDTYEQCGFDTITSALVHPWVLISNGTPIWDYLGEMADAILARSMGFDWAGTFRYRSRYEEEEKDPNAIEDIDGFDVETIDSNIIKIKYNYVIVRGFLYGKFSADRLLWTADGTNELGWSKGELLSIADNDYWPDQDTYGDYFAKFKIFSNYIAGNREWMYTFPQGQVELVGAKSIRKLVVTIGGNLTEITYDTSRPDGVYLLYQNQTGGAISFGGYGIFGKPVFRMGGRIGFIHDYFKDAIDIRKNGETTFRLENPFIMSRTQIDKLAEYHWGRRNTMHTYTKAFLGCWLFLLPGEWVNAEIGEAGISEYLDYKAEIREVNWSYNNRGRESTSIIFDEISENWKKQSTASCRFEEYGYPYKDDGNRSNHIVICSSEAINTADYYCDGTSDEDQINNAIDYLEALGGGTIELTEGTFYIDGSIDLKSNIQLIGQGNQTIIEKNCNDHGIDITGGSGTEITNVRLADFQITRNAADTNNVRLIQCTYMDESIIERVYFYNAAYQALRFDDCDTNKVLTCIINTTSNTSVGAWLEGYDNIITSNHFLNCDSTGLYVIGGRVLINSNIANNNSNGIQLQTADCTIANNHSYNNSGDGINLGSANRNTVNGNKCLSNGDDGITINSNSDNNILSGNMCDSNDRGIHIEDAPSTRNVVTGNRATGNTTANFTDSGTNTTDSGNDWN